MLIIPIRLPFHQAEKNFELRKEQRWKKEKEEKLRHLSELAKEASVVIKEGLKNEEKLISETTLVTEFIKAESKEEMEEKVTEETTDVPAELKNIHVPEFSQLFPRTPEGSQRPTQCTTAAKLLCSMSKMNKCVSSCFCYSAQKSENFDNNF